MRGLPLQDGCFKALQTRLRRLWQNPDAPLESKLNAMPLCNSDKRRTDELACKLAIRRSPDACDGNKEQGRAEDKVIGSTAGCAAGHAG